LRVLVVDDSRFSRGVLRGLFQKLSPGCTVTEAGDANAAQSMIEKEPAFDLITIDMHMPGKDGLTFAQELQGKGTRTRLALVTANNQEAIRVRAEGLGIRFVAKPLSEAKLAQLVEK
jgi:two-component system, chemotaxis family, chemotaxis protein CheY